MSSRRTLIYSILYSTAAGADPKRYTLWKVAYSFSKLNFGSKLNAQTTSERSKRRDQHGSPVLAIQRHIPLRQNVVAVRYRLPMARAKLGQGLADAHVEVGIHLVDRLAVSVQTRDRLTAHPFVAGSDLRSGARHGGGDRSADGVVHGSLQHFAQRAIDKIGGTQRPGKRIDRGDLDIVGDFFTQRHPRAPTVHGPAIVGERVGKIILEVVGRRQIAASAIHGYVGVVIVERSDLQLTTRPQLAVRGDFFVPAAFQYRPAVPPKQRRKGIESVDGSG